MDFFKFHHCKLLLVSIITNLKTRPSGDRFSFFSYKTLSSSNPKEWLAPNFSLQYHPRIPHLGYESKGNDCQLKKLLIVKQILLVSTLGNV